jgi:hypothetical protein
MRQAATLVAHIRSPPVGLGAGSVEHPAGRRGGGGYHHASPALPRRWLFGADLTELSLQTVRQFHRDAQREPATVLRPFPYGPWESVRHECPQCHAPLVFGMPGSICRTCDCPDVRHMPRYVGKAGEVDGG